MISWEDLQKSKTVQRSQRNSGHMLECITIVKRVYPNAQIVEVQAGALWALSDGPKQTPFKSLSNPYNSRYACWQEAAEILQSNDGVKQ